MLTDVIESDELNAAIMSMLSRAHSLTVPGVKLSRMRDGSVTPSHDVMSVLKTMSSDGGIENVTLSFVIDACERAERAAPASGPIVISTAMHLLEKLSSPTMPPVTPSPRDAVIDQMKAIVNAAISELEALATRPSVTDIRSMLASMFPDVGSMVYEAVILAGNECKIFVQPSPSTFSTVERTNGYVFRCSPDPAFYTEGRWEHDGVRVLLIDGLVETVSEVDTILNRAHVDSCPVAIVARGFNPDVLNTLRVNRSRRTLNVIPIVAEFDVETVNVLADIAVAIGCDVVSSLKGELISTVNFDDLRCVKKMSCAGRSMTIESIEPTAAAVSIHLQNLIQKKKDTKLLGVQKLLDDRIRSLSSASVTIRVSAKSGLEMTRHVHDIDVALRTVKASLSGGCVVCRSDAIMGVLRDYKGYTMPTLTIHAGLVHGLSLATSFYQAGLAVIGEID